MNAFSLSWKWAESQVFGTHILAVVGVFIIAATGLIYTFLLTSKRSKSRLSAKIREGFDDAAAEKEPILKITQLWIYPIKSLRGCQVQSATLEKTGFKHDRHFMLLKSAPEEEKKLKNMQISKFPQMCLFHTSIHSNTLTVQYWCPEAKKFTHELKIPLKPSLEGLSKLDVEMYGSNNSSYDMGEEHNSWFSARFGFPVVLAYWGGNPRRVLGNRPGRPAAEVPVSTLTSNLLRRAAPKLSEKIYGEDHAIAFNDVAPYLIVSEESGHDASQRLPDGVDMQICKFRGNIVVRNSRAAFDEDFWAELTLENGIRFLLTANCIRCMSLVVDYETGKSGGGETKDVYKLLAKDRRVDQQSKWSPVFGRYGFVEKEGCGGELMVGEKAVVSRRNKERTVFAWPGI